MLKQCLENIGKGLFHACISSSMYIYIYIYVFASFFQNLYQYIHTQIYFSIAFRHVCICLSQSFKTCWPCLIIHKYNYQLLLVCVFLFASFVQKPFIITLFDTCIKPLKISPHMHGENFLHFRSM